MNIDVPAGGEAAKPPLLRVSGVTKRYGAAVALHPIDLEVRQGSFTAILGPSGCGKSTLLRLIAGFAEPSTGKVEIGGRDVTRLGPENRPTNMVFQGYGLFPHMSVAENVGFGLSIARRPRPEIDQRVAEALRLVRLEDFASRRISALSGGQQQRVALARALIMRPLILLLDEPLAALDLKLRQAMQTELRRIHRETGGTFIFVTHDQSEAFSLADNLIVMNEGRIEQAGVPQDVYMRPNTLFVSQFVGDTNILPGIRRGDHVELALGARFSSPGRQGQTTFVLRPEALRLDAATPAGSAPEGTALRCTVEEMLLLGGEARVTLSIGNGETLVARLSDPRDGEAFRPGMTVTVRWADKALSEVGVAA
ncbi:ABC transporter ATP-binding protein [Mesorhizobium comanense]|uniref:ABC transporter ATP-binding protein n=1 Tax=Mesorhizobium comanense TaxID=2502215 RepID=UPI0010F96623|nr:ABC transporter ATP-binding protein [Mesorhizobium comanense]